MRKMQTEQLERLAQLQQVDQEIQTKTDKIDTLLLLIESLMNRKEMFEKVLIEEESENEMREKKLRTFFNESENIFNQLNLSFSEVTGPNRQETELSDIKNLIERKKKALLKKKKEAENQLNFLIADYDKRSEKINPELLKMYKGIRSQGNTIAISKVKDGVCQGCFINLPPQLFNELRNGNNYTYCNTCQRIIYYAGDE